MSKGLSITDNAVRRHLTALERASLCRRAGRQGKQWLGAATFKKMGTTDPKACTEACMKMAGSKYVLFNGASKGFYQLDDQKKPQPFAGQKVQVTGTLDKATKTIHVTHIKAAS